VFNASLLAWVLTGGPASVTPVDSATSSIVGYITGLGLAGIGLVVLWGLYIWPGTAMKRAVEAARADLLRELDLIRAEKAKVEEQRDEALQVAQEKLVPLLVNFVSVTTALVPLLQQVVAAQEHGHRT
jgi:hypothetical protein